MNYQATISLLTLTPALVSVAALAPQPALAQQGLELRCAANQVGQYDKIEFRILLARDYANPFDPEEVELNLRLTANGRHWTVPAYYGQAYERRAVARRDWMYPKGKPAWQARFAPLETGKYQAVAALRDKSGSLSSQPVSFECIASTNLGFVRVSQKDPRFLEFSQGQPFFPIGQNLAFIGDQQYVSLSKAEQIFSRLSENGANYLRIWTCCEDWAMAVEARKSAWGRSWDWHPPFVPMPGTEDTNRRCLKISGPGAGLNVNPAHAVALRPATRCVVSGTALLQPATSLRIEMPSAKPVSLMTTTPAPGRGWTAFRQTFETGANSYWLERMSLRLEGTNTALVSDLSLREAAGDGPELLWEAALNRPIRGFYNPLDCFILDEIVAAAEKHGLRLQLCLLTRDLYMNAMKTPGSAEYARAVADAKKIFRYAIARWGYSTSVAAWEYWNEMNPGLPCADFYTAVGEYLEQADPYHHLRTTSTWGPCARDCRHAKLDFADTHFYLRPSDKRLANEVEAVLDRTRWLREQAPNKPVHLGEFGLANEKWQPTDEMKQSRELVDFHNGLWASALSGSTGTGLFWWWDRLDKLNVYPIYRPLSSFIADVPWTSGEITNTSVSASEPRLRVIGLQTKNRAWLWIFDSAASWGNVVLQKKPPGEVQGAQLEIKNWPAGSYAVRWWDTREGKVASENKATAQNGVLRLAVPGFSRDLACRIAP